MKHNFLIYNNLMTSGIYRAYVIKKEDSRVYVPGLMNINIFDENNSFIEAEYEKIKSILPITLFDSKAIKEVLDNEPTPCWVVFENGDINRPVVMAYLGKGVKSVGTSTGNTSGNTNTSYDTDGGTDVSNIDVGDINIEVLTLNDIKSLSKAEYLALVMPLFKKLCAQDGISGRSVLLKYPGVFALQPFYEVNANFPQKLSNVAIKDNNLGGLKYSSSIPGATRGVRVPSNETGGNYCHFENISMYFYAQIWNVKSSTYKLAHGQQSNVTNFTRTFLNIWVKGNFAVNTSPVSYSESLLKDYNYYNLQAYEN